MPRGPRRSAMIVCLSYEVHAIKESVRFYHPDIVIVLSDVFNKVPVYLSKSIFSDYLRKSIESFDSHISFMSFDTDLHDFKSVSEDMEGLFTLLSPDEGRTEVMINITSSTPEFASAATVAAMVHDNVSVFSQKPRRCILTQGDIERLCSEGGSPKGFIREVDDPKELIIGVNELPDRNLVLGLRCLKECMDQGSNPMAKDMIGYFRD